MDAHRPCTLPMPRQPRLELPGIPLHVTQRGVNRCAIFIDDQDRHHFRWLLREACRKHGVTVHAFVLMDNHVHLLLGATQAGYISCAMRLAGQNYVQAFNLRHGRTATLWQGRFKSSLVDSDTYLLRVIRFGSSATSNSTRSAPPWWSAPRTTTAGPASTRISVAHRIHWLRSTPPTRR